MEGTFTEVEENAKLVYTAKAWTEGQEETTRIDQDTELALAATDNNKTLLNLRAVINKTGPLNATMAFEGMQMGFAQQLDKLEAFLAKQ